METILISPKKSVNLEHVKDKLKKMYKDEYTDSYEN